MAATLHIRIELKHEVLTGPFQSAEVERILVQLGADIEEKGLGQHYSDLCDINGNNVGFAVYEDTAS